jgi:SAM-dependent methyltransferase
VSYADIPGWFNWQDVYSRWAREAPEGAVFVEVGCFLGRSLAFLLEELGDKPATVYAVDPFVDDWIDPPRINGQLNAGAEEGLRTWGGDLKALADAHGGPFESFCWHMREHSRLERVNVIRVPSPRAARLFEPGSVDYVFLDGDHNYSGISADITAWRRAVRDGGRLGGHDHTADYPGVLRAVSEEFGPGHHVSVSSWEVEL